MISERLLIVVFLSDLRMASFSAVHSAHLPDSGVKDGTTLAILKDTEGFLFSNFFFQKYELKVVAWLVFSFLKEAVWLLYLTLNVVAVRPKYSMVGSWSATTVALYSTSRVKHFPSKGQTLPR